MKPLLPSDNIRDKIKEALEIVKYLKPAVCQNSMSQGDYDSLYSLLDYFRKFFSLSSKPFCVECRYYYGMSTGYRCHECKIGVDTYFSKLRKSDFQYPKVKDHYKGKIFKHLLDKPEILEEPKEPEGLSDIDKMEVTMGIKEMSPKDKFKIYLEKKKNESS